MNTIETNCSSCFEEEQQEQQNEPEKYTHNLETSSDINTVWSKDTFSNNNSNKKPAKHEISLKMGWRNQTGDVSGEENLTTTGVNIINNIKEKDGEKEEKKCPAVSTPTSPIVLENEGASPAHHARRPMNAFLIFCKKHRPIVRKKFPNLENRGVTRILGEWWAMLDNCDKEPYQDLAKEYKDAFFSANPGFKWYKLPAPPLRTLVTRPGSVQKEPLLPHQCSTTTLSTNQRHESEFTPGKLADESQLGNLTSLMQSTFGKRFENSLEDQHPESPPNVTDDPNPAVVPSKPIKKRKDFEMDTKKIVRNIFETTKISNISNISSVDEKISNQELMDKVVENMILNQSFVPHLESSNGGVDSNNLLREPRKSERSCKGLKYIEFMSNGKLLKNKREKQQFQTIPDIVTFKKDEEKLEKLDLQQTIRRLAERTNKTIPDFTHNHNLNNHKEKEKNCRPQRIYTNSESSSEENFSSKSDFNLEDRISGLPTLNYDVYMQRKRESKKRKLPKTKQNASGVEAKHPKLQSVASSLNNNNNNNNNNILIGSQKRKNKRSITHLGMTNDEKVNNNNNNLVPTDLSGLTTLAEIAANSQKIN
ncbi:HMG box transcription factor BBX isoform X2 [Onthophagus taurus]|nr:HMG box transcription factor BBX isoform X2 [Onthophagus taurus]